MTAAQLPSSRTRQIWWGDFYSPSFPRHLYEVVDEGYCCVYVKEIHV